MRKMGSANCQQRPCDHITKQVYRNTNYAIYLVQTITKKIKKTNFVHCIYKANFVNQYQYIISFLSKCQSSLTTERNIM